MTTRLLAPDWTRVIVYTHRWLGIAGGLFFVMWFVSGIVMMYARMPDLASEERMIRLSALDLSNARVGPAEAARLVGLSPERVRVGMLGDRPVYRFVEGNKWTTVFADSGQLLGGLTPGEAVSLARRFAPEHSSTIRYDSYLTDSDQWTLQVSALMPVHRIAFGDSEDTYLYVSDRTGEAVMKTTRRNRRWAYLGAVPHWIYFTSLRRHAALWAKVVLWLSIAGCLLALTGLGWGLWRYSPASRYLLRGISSHSPYTGLVRWHHYAGLVFGLTTFTWILSGSLSLDPWNWHSSTSPSQRQREAVAGGSLRLNDLTTARMDDGLAAIASSFAPKELEVVQFQGKLFLVGFGVPLADPASEQANTDLSPLEHRLVSVLASQNGTFTRFDDGAMLAGGASSHARNRCRGGGVAPAIRLLLLRPRRQTSPTRASRALQRLGTHMALSRPTAWSDRAQRGTAQSRQSLVVSRTAQFRLSVPVLPAAAVGYRRDRIVPGRNCFECGHDGAGLAAF